MARPMVAESIPIKPARLILGLIACLGLIFTLFTLLFGFTSVPANSVGVKTRFGAYHDIVNPGLAYAIPYIDEIHIVLCSIELLIRKRIFLEHANQRRHCAIFQRA